MYLSLLLTAHLPYLRHSGRSPLGEEPLHRLIARGLLPLIDSLRDLRAAGEQPRIGLACSPLLLDQLLDPHVQQHFMIWIEERLSRRNQELSELEHGGNPHEAYLARFYLEWDRRILASFEEHHGRNLGRSLRDLVNEGIIEPLVVPASHAYLPLLSNEQSVRAQIEHGLLHTIRHLGRAEGLWLPGCGWREGIERLLNDVGLRYVVVDPRSNRHSDTPVRILPRLTALFPSEAIARHIWSPTLGYPGDPQYRNPDEPDGYQAIGLHTPQAYDPYHAMRRTHEHAEHFLALLQDEAGQRNPEALALVPIDLQLLGPLWFEGPIWLQAVLSQSSTYPQINLSTPGAYVRKHRAAHEATLSEAVVADERGHGPWNGAGSERYWEAIWAAEQRMISLANTYAAVDGEQERVLNQAAREILLAQCSDWPEILSSDPEHPDRQRWETHLTRFGQLAEMSSHAALSAGDRFVLAQLEDLDGPFPQLNFRIFAE